MSVIISTSMEPLLGVAPPPPDPLTLREPELTVDELTARMPDPGTGLFLAACSRAPAMHDPMMGGPLVAKQIMEGIGGHPRFRRWYLSNGRDDELYPADRALQTLLVDHLVPMPVFQLVGHPECVRLVKSGFVHAFFQPGPIDDDDLLMRAGCQAFNVPAIGCLHTIHDKAAYFMRYYSGPTFDFDLLISPSECGRKVIQAQFDTLAEALGVAPFNGEITVIPYGVRIPEPQDREAARARLGWRDDERVLLAIGRIDRDFKYEPTPLLLAFRALRQKVKARLVLAGNGEEADIESVEAEARALGIGDCVELRPSFPTRDKAALLAGADVFVGFSDNLQETHGVAVLEAMAAGLPVVAADWDGYRETVADAGVLVPTRMHDGGPVVQAAISLGVPRAASGVQARHTIVDMAATVAAFERVCKDAGALGEAGRARVAKHYDARDTIERKAQAIEARVKAARAKPGTSTRRSLGSDWTRVFGHYASEPLAFTKTGPGAWPLASLPLPVQTALGISRRKLLQDLLADAEKGAAVADLIARHPRLDPDGVTRWLVRAAKYGVLTLLP